MIDTAVIYINSLDCGDCAQSLEKTVSKWKGIELADMNFIQKSLSLQFKENEISLNEIILKIKKLGYDVQLSNDDIMPEDNTEELKASINFAFGLPVLISAIFFGLGIVFELILNLSLYSVISYTIAIAFPGYKILKKGIAELKIHHIGINFLMIIAVIGAIALGEWTEATAIVFLFALANLLEEISLDKSRKAIKGLATSFPKIARLKGLNNEEKEVDIKSLKIDDVVIIKVGDIIPADGVVIKGESYVNQAQITGESVPVLKSKDDNVFAGTINNDGVLEVRISKLYNDTLIARIIHLIEEARLSKTNAEMFVDTFSKYYTPSVLLIAVLTSVLFPLLLNQPFSKWVYRGLVLLVVSCPCSLVISTPIAIVSALTNSTKNGILIKGGIFLELINKIKKVAFDKTGTLTDGDFKVKKVSVLNGFDEKELIKIAASLERPSTHPIAVAVVNYNSSDVLYEVEEWQNFKGEGVSGLINGARYLMGSRRFIEKNNIKVNDKNLDSDKTVFIANKNNLIGVFYIGDKIKKKAKELIDFLKKNNIMPVMLTGDEKLYAESVGKQVGINEIRYELLPEDKLNFIKNAKTDKFLMVGDGINDAPSLAQAEIGIAMGALGSQTAIESADIVLFRDDISLIKRLFLLGRKTYTVIKQNVIFSIILKIFFVLLGLSGYAMLWMAVLADMGSSLFVILNSFRVLFYNKNNN